MSKTAAKVILHGDDTGMLVAGERPQEMGRKAGAGAVAESQMSTAAWSQRQWKRQAAYAGKFCGR